MSLVYVVSSWSYDHEQEWVVGVYTDKETAKLVASKPRRSYEAIELDKVPVLG